MSGDEAAVFGRYVLGRDVDAEARDTYARAARELTYDTLDPVTRFTIRRPWSLGALDGALALTRPDALLRKKLLLMAAVLEVRPEYCDAFLPRERPAADIVAVSASVVRACLLAGVGLLLLPFIR
jgi:hypothetical protein